MNVLIGAMLGVKGNGGMLGVNVLIGAILGVNVLNSECFDKCNLMLRMNIWGMDMEMLMLGMLGS